MLHVDNFRSVFDPKLRSVILVYDFIVNLPCKLPTKMRFVAFCRVRSFINKTKFFAFQTTKKPITFQRASVISLRDIIRCFLLSAFLFLAILLALTYIAYSNFCHACVRLFDFCLFLLHGCILAIKLLALLLLVLVL